MITRAPRTSIEDRGGELIVRVTAAPVEGAANEAVIKAVAEALDVPGSEIAIESGGKARRKVLSAPAEASVALARLKQ